MCKVGLKHPPINLYKCDMKIHTPVERKQQFKQVYVSLANGHLYYIVYCENDQFDNKKRPKLV